MRSPPTYSSPIINSSIGISLGKVSVVKFHTLMEGWRWFRLNAITNRATSRSPVGGIRKEWTRSLVEMIQWLRKEWKEISHTRIVPLNDLLASLRVPIDSRDTTFWQSWPLIVWRQSTLFTSHMRIEPSSKALAKTFALFWPCGKECSAVTQLALPERSLKLRAVSRLLP